MNNWTLYILHCADHSLYTGITRDLERRLNEHNYNAKLAAAYTYARRPVKIVYKESYTDRSSASKREAEIKKLTKAEKETLISQQSLGDKPLCKKL